MVIHLMPTCGKLIHKTNMSDEISQVSGAVFDIATRNVGTGGGSGGGNSGNDVALMVILVPVIILGLIAMACQGIESCCSKKEITPEQVQTIERVEKTPEKTPEKKKIVERVAEKAGEVTKEAGRGFIRGLFN